MKKRLPGLKKLPARFNSYRQGHAKQLLWVAPLITALILFGFTRPVLARLAGNHQGLSDNSDASKFTLGSESIKGYQQIYYQQDGVRAYLTDGEVNHSNPVGRGEYIAWIKTLDGAGQIERYHIPTGTTVQLSRVGTNQNPQIYGDMVVWERWVNDRWQIFFFDGTSVKQITSGDVAVNADINGKYIVFARQDASGQWRAEIYTIADGKVENLNKSGAEAIHPKLD